jgi:hypothetical protein
MDTPARPSIAELDLLRGLAIVLMIVNHAGMRLLDPAWRDSGPVGALVFLGSFAPVVFFFTTGFGTGVARRTPDRAALGSVLAKSGLLLLADQFMFWRTGAAWGLDFLGFIAIATALVTTVAMARRPGVVCGALIAVLLALRFGLGRVLGPDVPDAVAWLTGTRAVHGVSYPLSPWMVYALLGFVAGRHCPAAGDTVAWVRARRSVGVGTLLAFAAAALLHAAHATFFRWGTMSVAFFVLSLAVLGCGVLAAWWLTAHAPRASRVLSLRGIASLAVVPIHYAWLEAVAATGVAPLPALAWLAVVAAVAAASIATSAAFVRGVHAWLSAVVSSLRLVVPATLVAACAAVVWLFAGRPLAFAAFVAGQLGITALMALRNERRHVRKRLRAWAPPSQSRPQ